MLALLFAAAVLNATDRGIFAIAMPAIKHTYSFTGGSWRPKTADLRIRIAAGQNPSERTDQRPL